MEIISRQIIDDSIYLATDLLKLTKSKESRADKSRKKEFSKLIQDENAIKTTQELSDQVIRIQSSSAAIKMFRNIAIQAKSKGFSFVDYIGLKLLYFISFIAPPLVLFIVKTRVKLSSKGIINSALPLKLKRYLKKKRKKSIDINLNLLGEAVLGEKEADKRFQDTLALMELEEVTYVSVKISAIVSQLIAPDYIGNVEKVATKLRIIYRRAKRNNCFVNLDMEEFKDVEITVGVFQKLLIEDEFKDLYAGIVIQAYLPEAHSIFNQLVKWSNDRYQKYGSKIKIRLVKGANLAMEKTEAELHGWNAAPYESKIETDASYARLINLGLATENKNHIKLGIASHNIFHISYAQKLAEIRDVKDMLEIEMLEGMANAEALAVKDMFGSVLLYSPITTPVDFPAAVAYLVRRLDENTSEENYLRASFDIEVNNKEFNQQAKKFIDSVHMSHVVTTESRRRASNALIREEQYKSKKFLNQADADITDKKFIDAVVNKLYMFGKTLIPVVVGGKEELGLEKVTVGEPGENNQPFYSHVVASKAVVDDSIRIAKFEQKNWSGTSPSKMFEIMGNVARNMENDRAKLIAAMVRDAGKTIAEANPEVSEAIDFARLYGLTALEKINGSSPKGVVVVASPWNFPYAIPAGGIIAALVSGNTVIFKPAPETVLTGWELVNQLWKSGVPKQALHFVPTRDDEVGEHLIGHKDVDSVVLTGSFETAELFSSWNPDLHLIAETSGKNSMIITSSADIDLAVKDLIQSAFGHAGQKCSAASLAIVDEKMYDNPSFFKQLVDATTSLTYGNPVNLNTSIGPVINQPSGKLLKALTELEEGEEWLVQPKQVENTNVWSPGIKINVQPDSWTHQTEWFGPVLGIMKAPDLKTAVGWQNKTEFGLTAGLHSLSKKECEYWLKNVEAGNLYINRPITGAIVERQPFGGWKKSKFGPTVKAGSSSYPLLFKNFTKVIDYELLKAEIKSIWEEKKNKQVTQEMKSEINYLQYIPHKKVVVVIDGELSKSEKDYFSFIEKLLKIKVFVKESQDFRLEELDNISKIRWLSINKPPYEYQYMIDKLPIIQNSQREILVWIQEQSVSITNHRYGNTGFSPINLL